MDTAKPRAPSLIDIEVLDLGPLYVQAVEYYISQDASRKVWGPEKRSRLRIRTECRWGRVQTQESALFMLNEKGDGPREPLSSTVKAYISLYAELKADGEDKGFFETSPFCKVPVDLDAALTFKSLGLVALEEFVRAKIPEMEQAYEMWLSLLRPTVEKAKALRARTKAVKA